MKVSKEKAARMREEVLNKQVKNKNNKKEFLRKLKALLKEYNASIGFTCAPCSDTYGIYDGGIFVNMDGERLVKTDFWSMDASDL